MKALRALAVSILTGCSNMPATDHTWIKEGGTPGERDRLLTAAEVQARLAFPDTPMAGSTGPTNKQSESALRLARRDIVIRYMTAQGWRLAPREQGADARISTTTHGIYSTRPHAQ